MEPGPAALVLGPVAARLGALHTDPGWQRPSAPHTAQERQLEAVHTDPGPQHCRRATPDHQA